MAVLKFDLNDFLTTNFTTLFENIEKQKGAAHTRTRVGKAFDRFCVIGIDGKDEIGGHLTGPRKNIHFKIFKYQGEVFFELSKDDLSPSFGKDEAMRLIEIDLVRLNELAKTSRNFPLPYKHMNGFYLRKVKSVGKKGKQTIQKAINAKAIDESFLATLEKYKITMYHMEKSA